MENQIKKVGIIGSGNIGGNLGLHLAKAGYQVMFSSRHPEQLQELSGQAGPNASIGTIREAAEFGGIIVISIPFWAMKDLSKEILPLVKDKVIVDTTNPYPERDGELGQQVRDSPKGSTEFVNDLFPSAQVTKAFNTIYYKNLINHAFKPVGERFALPYSGDDEQAVKALASLIEDIGFGGVYVGKLSESKITDPDQPLYNKQMNVEAVENMLNALKNNN